MRAGDIFVIRATTLAIPLVAEVYREALEVGAFPRIDLGFDGQTELFYSAVTAAGLDDVSPLELYEAETITTRLTITAPFNTRGTAGIDPAKTARYMRTLGQIGAITSARSASGQLRWCGTLFPTNALAQEAGMSLGDYEKFVFSAMFLDRDDPSAEWRAFSVEQQKKVDFLDKVQTLRFVAEDTDLTLSVAGRKWMNSDGHRNFPSGEVFTGPIEDSANGTIRFTYPAVRAGHEVEDVRLTFEKGRVVKATARRGQEYLDAMLESDPGARFLGEVAVGNNYGIQIFTKNTLFDEKIGGTCHFALGSSYPETGGRNSSSLHWDMVCDLRKGGEILADGERIHRAGQWLIG